MQQLGGSRQILRDSGALPQARRLNLLGMGAVDWGGNLPVIAICL